mgnify:CR=1 FL=1
MVRILTRKRIGPSTVHQQNLFVIVHPTPYQLKMNTATANPPSVKASIIPGSSKLRDLCQAFLATRGENISVFCKRLIPEFGITDEEIAETELISEIVDFGNPEQTNARVHSAKLVKCTLASLRHATYELALERGLLAIGKELPALGKWPPGFVLQRIRTDGMLVVKAARKKEVCKDHISNPSFLRALFAQVT